MSGQMGGAALVEAGHGEYALGPLTIEGLDAMTGRELDAAVARYVMGWEKVRTNGVAWYGKPPGYQWSTEDVPNYSTELEAAWQVVEHLRLKATLITVGPWLPGRYCAYLTYAPQYVPTVDSERFVAPTAPLAICRTALKWALASQTPTAVPPR